MDGHWKREKNQQYSGRLVFAEGEEQALKLADMKSVCSKAETPFLARDTFRPIEPIV